MPETLFSHAITLQIINLLAAGMLVSVVVLLTQKGLSACIHLYTIQSALLALVSLAIAIGFQEFHLLSAVLFTVIVKVVFVPAMLFWIVKKIHVQREVQFYVNTSASLLLSGLLIALAFYIIEGSSLFQATLSKGAVGISLSLLFLGLFMMISRVKAITQLLGFLTMENGLFLLANVATFGVPLFIEIGIFFDVLVMLLIVGIFVFKINATFHHIDVTSLRKLKE
ncbi:MAG TPA: formate hydrogenlyase [Patescibacteria group bacterium]|nr:formate hydrogenlyase [Patescibacteria group bacterium]